MALFGATDPLPQQERDRVEQYSAEFESLRSAESTRLARYRDYREENESSRQRDSSQLLGETRDYGRIRDDPEPARHNISLPLGMALTVKHAYRIAGRFPDAHVERREENAQERYRSDTMEKMWWGILHHSEGETMFSSAAWHGSMLGSSVIEVKWDIDKQMPYLCPVDPAGILVVRGVVKVHDYQRVYQFWQAPLREVAAEYKDYQFAGTPVTVADLSSTHKVGTTEMVTICQMTDKKTRLRFAVGGSKKEGDRDVPLWEWNHNLGFVPLQVIPNIGPFDDVWGWADYEFVRSLVNYIPALMSREADIIRMVANGAFQEQGTGQDPNVIKRILYTGGVIPTRRDSKIEPVPAPDMPPFETAHSDRAMEMLKMLGFAPDAAWGADTRSGADRTLQLQPMVEFTAMKQTNWATGLSRLASMAFRCIEKLQVTDATYRGSKGLGQYGRGKAFAPVTVGPQAKPTPLLPNEQQQLADPYADPDLPVQDEDGEDIMLPKNPKELFDGDYKVAFEWANRIDPDDPAYVLSELNKFQQGAQSLRTTLEHLGHHAPEDEMRLMEQEAERFPWLRSGLIAMTKLQIEAQQAQGDQQAGPDSGGQQGDLSAATEMMGQDDGSAMDQDAGAAALGGPVPGQQYGGA